MDDNVTHVDLRPIGSDRRPPDDPPTDLAPLVETEDRDPGALAAVLLALGIAFLLIGLARLAWNVWEGALMYVPVVLLESVDYTVKRKAP